MRWTEFAQAAPALATALRQAFERPGVVLVGTIRADGSPRISPAEPVFDAGQLYLDMMWRSRKALDLLRDPRIEVHSSPVDRAAPQQKLWGRVTETHDADELSRFARVATERFGWEMPAQHHLFRVDVVGAALISYGEDAPEGWMRTRTWDATAGYEERGPYAPQGSD